MKIRAGKVYPPNAQILRQAVAEIQTARTTIARQVNTTVNSVYWNIGKLLFEKNLEGGYGSGVVNRLSRTLLSGRCKTATLRCSFALGA